MRLGAIAGMVLLLSTSGNAWAQHVDGRGIPYYAWDFNFGVGWVSSDPSTFALDSYYTSGLSAIQSFDLAGQFGHYWNSHLKTEAGLVIRPGEPSGRLVQSTLPDGSQLTAYFEESHRLIQISPSMTWQFLDNTFAHPYVSAGVNVNRIGINTTYAYASAVSSRGVLSTLTPPASPAPLSVTRTRPFAAAGFKSYFNDRTFVRPEVAITLSQHGAAQVALGFGFGVDF